jgi:hypothetical protein
MAVHPGRVTAILLCADDRLHDRYFGAGAVPPQFLPGPCQPRDRIIKHLLGVRERHA